VNKNTNSKERGLCEKLTGEKAKRRKKAARKKEYVNKNAIKIKKPQRQLGKITIWYKKNLLRL
jgi:hypothetical protein